MEIEELYALMAEFKRSGLGKLTYKNDGCEVSLELPEAAPVYSTVLPQAGDARGIAVTETAAAAAVSPEPAAPARAYIRSPLVGTYYAAPGEDSEPYVKKGDAVRKGETVCIIEAMKMMNEVAAPCDCVIEEILKENASAAGYDEPLLVIREI